MKARATKVAPNKEDIATIPDPIFKPGDPVKITGRRGRFVFKARRQNVKTGQEWLDIFGGLPNREAFRSVPPEAVKAEDRKKAV